MASFTITAPDGKSYTVEKEGVTAEEALAYVKQKYPAAPAGPSFGDMAADVQLAAEEGVNKGAEFMGDLAMLPTQLALRQFQGVKDMVSGPPEGEADGVWNMFKRYGQGVMREPSIEILPPSGITPAPAETLSIGDVTKEMFNPDELTRDQYRIPEGEGGKGFEFAKNTARLGTEMLATAPLGGAKYIKPALMTIAPASLGGAAGQEMGGDLGEAAGLITGALMGDPKGTIALVKYLAQKAGGAASTPYKWFRNWRSAKLDRPVNMDANPADIEEALREMVRNVYGNDPEKAQTTLESLIPTVRKAIEEGKQGTVGQLMDDPGLLSFEKAYADKNRLTDVDMMNKRIEQSAMAPIEAIPGDATLAGVAPRQELAERSTNIMDEARDFRRSVETPTAAELEAAQKAAAVPFEAADTVDASKGLYSAVEAGKNKAYDAVKKEFGKLGGTVAPAGVVQNTVKAEFLSKLNPNDARMFQDSFPNSFKTIAELEGDVTVDTMSNIVSLINSEMNQIARSNKPGTALEFADDFKDALYSAIDAGGGNPEQRKKAAALYREFQGRYGKQSDIGKALGQEPEKFGELMLKPGDSGKVKLDAMISGDRKSRAAAEKSLRALFKQRVSDVESGALSATRTNTFLKDYEKQLENFPALRDEIAATRDATRRLEQAVASNKAATKEGQQAIKKAEAEVAALQKTPAAKFAARMDDPDEQIAAAKKLMKTTTDTNKAENIKSLLDTVADYGPEAKDNIRRTFMDEFVNSVSKDGKLTQKGLSQFKRNRKIYEESGLFSAEELDRIESGLVEAQKLYMHDAAKIAQLPADKRKLVEIVAAVGGAKAGAALLGSPLIGAQIGRREAGKWVEGLTTERARKLAYEMSVNPDVFVDLISQLEGAANSAAETKKVLNKIMARLGTAGRGIAVENQEIID